MNNFTRFLELYKGFERWAKDKYPIDNMVDLELYDFGLNNYRSKLRLYRNLRNILSHNVVVSEDGKSSNVSVGNKLIAEFKKLVADLQSPATSLALDVFTVFKKSMSDKVLDAMRIMNERDFTHIPIMENGRIIGVFSENTLFKMFCNGDSITPEMKFEDLSHYIKIKNTVDSCYSFVPDTLSVPEVLDIFQKAKKENRRLDILFITDDGSSEGKFKGMISAWDMAAV